MAAEQRTYSRATKLKVRTLYLVHGLSPQEISEKVGITRQSVSNLAFKNGWAEQRRIRECQALARAEDRAAQAAGEFVESVVVQSQELAEEGFKRARGAEDGKEFALAMKGTQIAVQLARQGMGLDANQGAAGARAASLTVVFGAPFAEAAPEKVTEEPVEVSARDVSDDIILDFEDLQQGENPRAESAELIAKRA